MRGTTAGEDWLQLGFHHNCWKHEEDLTIRYAGVSSLDFGPTDQLDWAGFGALTVDEILPTNTGAATRSASSTDRSRSSAMT